MSKKIISTLVACVMVLLMPIMAFAAAEDTAEEAVIEETRDENVVVVNLVGQEDVDSDSESDLAAGLSKVGVEDKDIEEILQCLNPSGSGEEACLGAYNGRGYFEDEYAGIYLLGDNGKATITLSEGSRELVNVLVANNGFIQRKEANITVLLFINGSIYGYCSKYEGLNGKLFKLSEAKVTSFDYDGNSEVLQTTSGELKLPTDAEVKKILGIDDSGKDDSSSSSKDDGSSSSKDDGSSSSKDDGSSSSKDDGSSSGKDDGSSSGKDDGSSSKDDTSNITVTDVSPAYSFVDVTASVNGKIVTYRIKTGEVGEIQSAGITSTGLVYILFKDGKLLLWHPSMLTDLNQTSIDAATDMVKIADNCKDVKVNGTNGVVEFYDVDGKLITIPTISTIKSTVISGVTATGEYYVDNSVNGSKSGYKTWTLLQKVDGKYYVVKHDPSKVECKFEWIGKKKIMYNGKRYRGVLSASWSRGGELFIKTKKSVYVIRQMKKPDGSYKNKKMRFCKRTKDLYIDPNTNIAEYVVTRGGSKIDCVTGKTIQ